MCVYVYVYIYIYMSAYKCVNTDHVLCVYVCKYVGMWVCMNLCMYVCIEDGLYVCMYVCMYVCIYIYMYTAQRRWYRCARYFQGKPSTSLEAEIGLRHDKPHKTDTT